VAGGDCGKAPELLDLSGRTSSTLFPATEAESLAAACQLKQAVTLEQLLDFEQKLGSKLSTDKMQELRGRVAEAYSAQGVAAEDRKDPYAAMAAYQKALEWNPGSGKARFNLGSIYLEDRKFDEAESQYRALAQAHPDDYEAYYWLAESILAQPVTPARKSEACELLRRSLSVADPKKREQFRNTMVAVECR
jgi:tetratricopeptide (TPR) repeat protein